MTEEKRKNFLEIILPKLSWLWESMKSIIKGLEKASRVRWLLFFLFLCLITWMFFNINAGEKYSMQGGALSHKIRDVLVTTGYCPDKKNCIDTVFGRHGDKVNLNLYGITDTKIIAAVLSMVAIEGLKTTGGVPIRIQFFSTPKEELRKGFKEFTKKSTITMEVNE